MAKVAKGSGMGREVAREWRRAGLSSARKNTPRTSTNHQKTQRDGASQDQVRRENEG